MSTFTDIVLNRLGPIDIMELDTVTRAIEELEAKGWTAGEAASYLRWMEHVNPDIDEDTALRNMKAVRERVEARLACIDLLPKLRFGGIISSPQHTETP